eukprot:scaffold32734_cov45-Isochrysis_galbana.AAC.1
MRLGGRDARVPLGHLLCGGRRALGSAGAALDAICGLDAGGQAEHAGALQGGVRYRCASGPSASDASVAQ